MNLADHPWALIFFWIIWAGFVWFTYDEIKLGCVRGKLVNYCKIKNPILYKSVLGFQTVSLIALFLLLVYLTLILWFG